MRGDTEQLLRQSNFKHLLSICDSRGVFEHCEIDQPRREHGYCVDDVSRALIVFEREQSTERRISKSIDVLARFMNQSQQADGRVINRCDVDGNWHGEASTDDHWGRALWCWGSMVGLDPKAARVRDAYDHFVKSAAIRSPHPRSMVFAGLGAIEFLRAYPSNTLARALLEDALQSVPANLVSTQAWPEQRLTYANAALPELMISGGAFFERPEVVSHGLSMLSWLVALQTNYDHLSIVSAVGWAVGDAVPAFDQQPIEVAALADACSSAYAVTHDESWLEVLAMTSQWFEGANDVSVRMYDPSTGAGFDGLTSTGPNLNSGAESTLAYLSVMQHANRKHAVL